MDLLKEYKELIREKPKEGPKTKSPNDITFQVQLPDGSYEVIGQLDSISFDQGQDSQITDLPLAAPYSSILTGTISTDRISTVASGISIGNGLTGSRFSIDADGNITTYNQEGNAVVRIDSDGITINGTNIAAPGGMAVFG